MLHLDAENGIYGDLSTVPLFRHLVPCRRSLASMPLGVRETQPYSPNPDRAGADVGVSVAETV
jgi:hypothetical protein